MSSFKKLINKTSTKLASLGEEKASGVSEAGDGFPQTAAAAHSLPILTPGEGTSGSTSLPVECEASGTRKGKGASAMVLPTGQEKVALDARMWQKEKEMQTARAEILKPRECGAGRLLAACGFPFVEHPSRHQPHRGSCSC